MCQFALLGALSLTACIYGINPEYDDILEDHGSETDGGATQTGTTQSYGPESGEPMPDSLELPASFAACRSTGVLSPAQCTASANKPNALVIDLESPGLGLELVACLTFMLDDTLAGKSVTWVALEVHTTPGVGSGSITSGEVWAVEPFTVDEFKFELPPKLGAEPLAPNPGPAQVDKPIQWQLPTEIAIPNTQLYLCVYPVSDDDIHFFSNEGEQSPILMIEYE